MNSPESPLRCIVVRQARACTRGSDRPSIRTLRTTAVVSFALILIATSLALSAGAATTESGTLVVRVRNGVSPVAAVSVTAGPSTTLTDAKGMARFTLPPGMVEISVDRTGFATVTLTATVESGRETTALANLHEQRYEEIVTVVSATRSGTIIEDQPIRVEAVPQEEIEENLTIAPGNLSTLLNELAGVYIQPASPSLGGSTLRLQGLSGRYTQILADQLPIYGAVPDLFNVMQIPPLDLARVEVIKGASSALYGGSALGGVLNLVSRRPGAEPEVLLNATSHGGADLSAFASARFGDSLGMTVLGSGHRQDEKDLDGDGWAELPEYRRWIVRPRVFWDAAENRSFFATLGVMEETREGGTVGNSVTPGGSPFRQSLDTERVDGGLSAQALLGDAYLLRASVSGRSMSRDRLFDKRGEREGRRSLSGELDVSGSIGGHTWLVGGALERDALDVRERGDLDYRYTTTALFAQDEMTLSDRFSAVASGRVDFHSTYGTFFSPRFSLLVRPAAGTSVRLSAGIGYAVPVPINERTEVVGFTPLLPLGDLDPERARSASIDVAWSTTGLEVNGTLFGSTIDHALQVREAPDAFGSLEIVNAPDTTRTWGTELLIHYSHGPLHVIATHSFVDATESAPDSMGMRDVPLIPAQQAELAAIVENEARGRIGVEIAYTGRQALEDNPYRDTSEAYTEVSILGELRIGEVRVFVNAVNLTDVRQSDFDPIYLPEQTPDGRWTTESWAPLEGRVVNAGLRLEF